jgi:3-phosphoshikimate 1-carboxyvinyltransferase
MNWRITPGKPLSGLAVVPGDKSLSHRAALLAALAEGESQVENFLVSGVTLPLLLALRQLGVNWQLQGTALQIEGRGLNGLRSPGEPVDCGNSATILRLSAGALAAAGVPAVLDGSAGLRRRPMRRILEPLRLMGVEIESSAGHTAPLALAGRPPGKKLRPIEYSLPIASAQVKSCLLIAALAAGGRSILHEPGPSRDHTERMLRAMGVPVQAGLSPIYGKARDTTSGAAASISIQPVERLTPLQLRVPGDLSSAAFLIVAAVIAPGSAIRLNEVGLNPTRTGLIDALRAMGADIEVEGRRNQDPEPAGDLVVRHSALQGVTVGGDLVVRMIDEFPALAVAAAFARGRTVVSGAQELRYKESDRIAALCAELRALGAQIQEHPDGFTIEGGQPLAGGHASTHGDHRLAMALALAGLAAQTPVAVSGAEIAAESFPGFASTLRALGADIQEV